MPDIKKVNSLNVGLNVDPSEALRLVAVNLEQITSELNLTINSLSRHDLSGKGPVQSDFDPRFTLQPNFNNELGITPAVSGLDGTSLFIYSKPDFTLIDPLFRKSNEFGNSRPRSIYETFVAFKNYLDNRINNLSIVINGAGSSCIDNCEYTKDYIGREAFDPGQASAPGSMDFNIRLALRRIDQLASSVFGPNFPLVNSLSAPFPPIGANGCTIARRLNALLQIHNGSPWSLFAFGASCNVQVSHDGQGGGGGGEGGPTCIPRYVDFFPTQVADSYLLLGNGTKSPVNHSSFTIDEVPDYSTIDSLFSDPDPAASPVSIDTAPGLPLWQFSVEDTGSGDEGVPAILCNRWVWNLNGALRKAKVSEGSFGEIEEEKSKLTLDTKLDFSFIYEFQKSTFASGDIFNSVTFDQVDNLLSHRFEITVFGKVIGEDTHIPIAKKTGSLSDLSNLSPWDFQESPAPGFASILPGSNKITALKGIKLAEFDWLSPLDPDDFKVEDNGESISNLLTHAQVVVYHKPGGKVKQVLDLILDSNGPDSATELEEIAGKLKFIGCEIQYFDDTCLEEEEGDCFYSDEEGDPYVDANGNPYVPVECEESPDPGPDPDPDPGNSIFEEDFEEWEDWPFIEDFENVDWTEEPDEPEELTGPFVEDFEGGDW